MDPSRHRGILSPFPGLWLSVAVVAGLGFIGLADGVEDLREGGEVEGLAQWDDEVHAWLAPRVPSWAHAASLVFNGLGGALPSVALAVAASILLWARHEHVEAAFLVIAAVCLEALVYTFKILFSRPRPDGGLLDAGGHSFPSGHAAFGAFLGCMLVWTALRHFQGRSTAIVLMLAGTLWTALMAASRVALGVHYLTDVLAGALLGIAVAAGGIAAPDVVRWLRRASRAGRGTA